MYLLAFLRCVLGVLSRTIHFLRDATTVVIASDRPRHTRVVHGRRVPQDWLHMDYVLSESSSTARRLLQEAFERPTHPLGALFRIVRRLAGVRQACPALVPKSASDLRARKSRR